LQRKSTFALGGAVSLFLAEQGVAESDRVQP
jgi:hypothetical protein